MDYDNGRRSSDAYSSSSDFYSAADKPTPANASVPPPRSSPPPPSPSPPALPQQREESTANTQDHHDADDEGDSDAMDLSTDSSNAGSPSPQPETAPRLGSKRKASDVAAHNGDSAEGDSAKKPKLSNLHSRNVDSNSVPFLGLPEELWQQVFLCLPPVMLGRCLSVCRTFNTYLTKTKSSSLTIKSKDLVAIKDGEAIWTQCRKTFYPNLPKPLSRCSELRMLQLVGGRTCEFCHRQLPRLLATDPFHCGPGLGGLRTVWPFAVRTCGKCLESNTLKVSLDS